MDYMDPDVPQKANKLNLSLCFIITIVSCGIWITVTSKWLFYVYIKNLFQCNDSILRYIDYCHKQVIVLCLYWEPVSV